MDVLEDGAALHDWYTPGNDICLPPLAGVVDSSLLCSGMDQMHGLVPTRSIVGRLCVYL